MFNGSVQHIHWRALEMLEASFIEMGVIHVQLTLIEGVGRGEGIEGATAYEQGESDTKRFSNYWVYN